MAFGDGSRTIFQYFCPRVRPDLVMFLRLDAVLEDHLTIGRGEYCNPYKSKGGKISRFVIGSQKHSLVQPRLIMIQMLLLGESIVEALEEDASISFIQISEAVWVVALFLTVNFMMDKDLVLVNLGIPMFQIGPRPFQVKALRLNRHGACS